MYTIVAWSPREVFCSSLDLKIRVLDSPDNYDAIYNSTSPGGPVKAPEHENHGRNQLALENIKIKHSMGWRSLRLSTSLIETIKIEYPQVGIY